MAKKTTRMMSRSTVFLGDEIFSAVQDAQGRGFISDGLCALDTPEQVFAAVRGHLKNTERAAKIVRQWLRKYNELNT